MVSFSLNSLHFLIQCLEHSRSLVHYFVLSDVTESTLSVSVIDPGLPPFLGNGKESPPHPFFLFPSSLYSQFPTHYIEFYFEWIFLGEPNHHFKQLWNKAFQVPNIDTETIWKLGTSNIYGGKNLIYLLFSYRIWCSFSQKVKEFECHNTTSKIKPILIVWHKLLLANFNSKLIDFSWVAFPFPVSNVCSGNANWFYSLKHKFVGHEKLHASL